MKAIIVKIGGSCSSHLSEIVSHLKDCLKSGKRIIVVPGGWIFSDTVRKLSVDDDTAHWMAVASMDIYGYYISSFGTKLLEADDFDFYPDGVSVLLPYRLMRKHDELPHSWDVTSDSISVWLAGKLGIKKVVKLTDVDGVFVDGEIVDEISAEELMKYESCVDKCCPSLMIKYGVDMFVCNGLKGRVKDYILRGRAVGTLIYADK